MIQPIYIYIYTHTHDFWNSKLIKDKLQITPSKFGQSSSHSPSFDCVNLVL